MKVLFVAGFGPVHRDPVAAPALYVEALGLPLRRDDDGYWHPDRLPGVKSFARWPLAQAAQSCFGAETWPAAVPVPQAWVEFDVEFDGEDVAAATAELAARGYALLVAERDEPWGQTVTRLLGPEGLLVGITRTPALRDAAPSSTGG